MSVETFEDDEYLPDSRSLFDFIDRHILEFERIVQDVDEVFKDYKTPEILQQHSFINRILEFNDELRLMTDRDETKRKETHKLMDPLYGISSFINAISWEKYKILKPEEFEKLKDVAEIVTNLIHLHLYSRITFPENVNPQ